MAKHVTSADLRHQITIEHRVDDADNTLGESVPDWQPLVSGLWAQKQPLRGREFFAAGQMQAPADVRYRIRYRAGITAAMRVVDNGQPHEIVGQPIDVDGAGITLELMCIAGVRDGR